MADTTTNTAEETSSATATAEKPDLTTTNDGAIAINQAPGQKTDSTTEPVTPVEEVPATVTPPASPASNEPVILSEKDVADTPTVEPTEDLAEHIESLTGEVQALEAKIEKLTSGVAANASEENTSMPVPPVEQPKVAEEKVEPAEKIEMPIEEKAPEPVTTEKPKVTEEEVITTPPTPPVQTAAKPVDDVYGKVLSSMSDDRKVNDKDTHKDLNDDASLDEGVSGLGIIAQVLIVFGIIAFLGLLASPFYKEILGSNWSAIGAIAWPTAVISLVLGFLLSIFTKVAVSTKIFGFILALFGGLLYIGISGHASWLGPLQSVLDSIVSFYK